MVLAKVGKHFSRGDRKAGQSKHSTIYLENLLKAPKVFSLCWRFTFHQEADPKYTVRMKRLRSKLSLGEDNLMKSLRWTCEAESTKREDGRVCQRQEVADKDVS